MMGLSWIVLIALVIWGFRYFDLPRKDEPSRSRAILEERYARGEIDTDEFNRRMGALETR